MIWQMCDVSGFHSLLTLPPKIGNIIDGTPPVFRYLRIWDSRWVCTVPKAKAKVVPYRTPKYLYSLMEVESAVFLKEKMDYFEAYANWYRTELYKVFDDRYVECVISCNWHRFATFIDILLSSFFLLCNRRHIDLCAGGLKKLVLRSGTHAIEVSEKGGKLLFIADYICTTHFLAFLHWKESFIISIYM